MQGLPVRLGLSAAADMQDRVVLQRGQDLVAHQVGVEIKFAWHDVDVKFV